MFTMSLLIILLIVGVAISLSMLGLVAMVLPILLDVFLVVVIVKGIIALCRRKRR